MTLFYEVEEKINKEDDRQKNYLREMNKILDALEAMPMGMNWGKIFSLIDERC